MFFRGRRRAPSLMPFRPARSVDEAIRMQDALDAAVASGDATLARVIAAAIRASDIDSNDVGIVRSLRSLDREPVEVVAPTRFDDMSNPLTQDIAKSVRSFDALRSGRTANLRNQPYARPAGAELRAAAEEALASRQQAAAAENLARAAALTGAGGLAGMIADSSVRMQPSPDGMRDMGGEAVDMTPMDEPPMPEIVESTPVVMEEPVALGDIGFDNPMDTADLVAESRPIPDSTPMALIREAIAAERAARPVAPPAPRETLTPAEIDALRGKVVSIRDAATGAPMDSFYPPESEEYKREQRMKLRYPQLRR